MCVRAYQLLNDKSCIRATYLCPHLLAYVDTHTLLMKSHSLHIIAITERYKPISVFLWAWTHTQTRTGLSLHAVKLFQLYYPSDVLFSVVCSNAWGGEDR